MLADDLLASSQIDETTDRGESPPQYQYKHVETPRTLKTYLGWLSANLGMVSVTDLRAVELGSVTETSHGLKKKAWLQFRN